MELFVVFVIVVTIITLHVLQQTITAQVLFSGVWHCVILYVIAAGFWGTYCRCIQSRRLLGGGGGPPKFWYYATRLHVVGTQQNTEESPPLIPQIVHPHPFLFSHKISWDLMCWLLIIFLYENAFVQHICAYVWSPCARHEGAWESGSIDPRILYLDARGSWMLSFTPWLLYSWENSYWVRCQ